MKKRKFCAEKRKFFVEGERERERRGQGGGGGVRVVEKSKSEGERKRARERERECVCVCETQRGGDEGLGSPGQSKCMRVQDSFLITKCL